MTPAQLRANLATFTKHRPLPRSNHETGMLYTAGVKYLAVVTGAFWLIDFIGAFHKRVEKAAPGVQVWELAVTGKRGLLTSATQAGTRTFEQPLPFTDFPLDSITLYLENEVLMLPSER